MRVIALFAVVAALSVTARAATTFTVDPNASAVTLSGTTVGNSPLTQQGPGSLTTQLEGALDVDLSATEIAIVSGVLDARENGTWRPGLEGGPGSAPADFGAQALLFGFQTIYGALRNVEMEVFSPSEAIADGNFDASELVFLFPTNSNAVLDFEGGLAGTGSAELAGEARNRTATVGTITGTEGSRVLTIQVDTTFTFTVASDDDTMLTIRGQIVAREGDVVPDPDGPEITDIEVVDDEVRITASGTTAAAEIEASTDLEGWEEKEAQITATGAATRVFTLPVSGPKEFYRIVQ